MNNKKLQVCKNCIMDTTDSTITFDDKGWCDYCKNYHSHIVSDWDTGERGERELLSVAKKIKAEAEKSGYLIDSIGSNLIKLAFTEKRTKEEIDSLINFLKKYGK